MMSDPIAFARAQLDAAEKLARAIDDHSRWKVVAGACGPQVRVQEAVGTLDKGVFWERADVPFSVWDCDDYSDYEGCAAARADWMREAEFIAVHDPAWVLADIAVKRRILNGHPHVPAVQQHHGEEFDFGCQTCHADPDCGVTRALGWCETVLLLVSAYRVRPHEIGIGDMGCFCHPAPFPAARDYRRRTRRRNRRRK